MLVRQKFTPVTVTTFWERVELSYIFLMLKYSHFLLFPIETTHRCGFFFDVFGLGLPDYLNCKILTDSNDPDVCIGLKEVQQAKIRAQRPSNRHDKVE